MIDLPQLPHSFSTRQVTCICCNEKFTLSEAYLKQNYADGDANAPDGWRASADHSPHTVLRQQDTRTLRPVRTQTRAEPHALHPHRQDNDGRSDYALNCPRCGADNRNWVQISAPAPLHFLRARLFHGVDTNFSISIAVLLAFLLSVVAFVAGYQRNPEWAVDRLIPLSATMFLTGFATAVVLSGQWRAVLQTHRINNYLPNEQRIPPTIWTSIGLWLLFAFAVPIFIYLFLPWFVNLILGPPPPSPTPRQIVERLENTLVNLLEEGNLPPEPEADARALLATSQDFLTDLPLDAPQVSAVETLIGNIEQARPQLADAGPEIDSRLAELRTYLNENRPLLQPPPFWSQRDSLFRFLVLWAAFVTLTSAVVSGITIGAVNSFVRRVDGQIPPPLYHSVANMTRVVAWEAKQALEVRGDMEHVQWVHAERTEEGGVELRGVHRDDPVFDNDGRIQGDHVPAQVYKVLADRWGRIITARIREWPNAPLAPGTPRFVFPAQQQQQPPVYPHAPLQPVRANGQANNNRGNQI